MNMPTPNIIHESETQRQFIRLQLPAHADINGNRYTVNDLSSGGMSVRDAGKVFQTGNILDIVLVLPFADFALDIDLKAEVQHIDKKSDIAGCRFVDLNANQISILNHVIKSFMSGDVIGANDVINVVSRENFVNVRKHQANQSENTSTRVKRYGIYALIICAIFFLSSFIINNIIEKLFIIKSPFGQVSAQTIDIVSPQPGTFKSALTAGVKSVKQGQVIGYIDIPNGGALLENETASVSLKIISPCDCFIAEQFILDGEYRPQDTTLFKFINQKSDVTIQTKVKINNIHRLNVGAEAVINISGVSDAVKGQITNIIIDETPALSTQETMGIVMIKPNTTLPIDLIDRPAFVEFHL